MIRQRTVCIKRKLCPAVLQAIERKKVKLTHEGVHKNDDQFLREMKPVVKATDTIPFGVRPVSGCTCIFLCLHCLGKS